MEDLRKHLSVLERAKLAEVWSDVSIEPGDQWRKKISDQLNAADIAIILVSKDSLASEFINSNEIPRLRSRGKTIIPVLLRPVAYGVVEWISDIQVFPPSGRFILEGDEKRVDEDFAALTTKVHQIITKSVTPSSAPSAPPAPDPVELPPPASTAPPPPDPLEPNRTWKIRGYIISLIALIGISLAILYSLDIIPWWQQGMKLTILIDGQPASGARVALVQEKEEWRKAYRKTDREGRVVLKLPEESIKDTHFVSIDIDGAVDYLPVAREVRLAGGRKFRIDLPQKELARTPPLVDVPKGKLYRGIWDDTVTLKVLYKYNQINREQERLADNGLGIKYDLDKMFTHIDSPPRRVKNKAFDIDKYEVTNRQYRKYLEKAGKSRKFAHPDEPEGHDHTPSSWSKTKSSKFILTDDDQPVSGVDFFDAYSYCRWADKRLPTEDEWEVAARGFDGRVYPWGLEYDPVHFKANNGDRSGPRAATALTPERRGGPAGMSGNVSEWTSSHHSNDRAITKGGSWTRDEGDFFALSFLSWTAVRDDRGLDTGFRCASDADGGEPRPGMVRIEPGTAYLGGEESPGLDLIRYLSRSTNLLIESIIKDARKAVEVPGFLMDPYEVTNREYRAFLQYIEKLGDQEFAHPEQPRGKDHTPKFWNEKRFNQDMQPVVGIDWYDAYAYAKWADKRLPTRDEWERAGRGSTKLLYPWGDTFSSRFGVFKESPHMAPAPVNSHTADASPLGCLHMAGNVQEWTGDLDPDSKAKKAYYLRGSSWKESGRIRGLTFFRLTFAPRMYRGNEVGFRCAKDRRPAEHLPDRGN